MAFPRAQPARRLCALPAVWMKPRLCAKTVAILKQADTAPLDVTGYGTLAEREAQGHDIDPDERALMQRALDENAVVVAQLTPFFGDAETG